MPFSNSCSPSIFLRAHDCWEKSDLEGSLACMSENVVYLVNVDGQQVPYAMSSLGKEDVRHRLQLLLYTMRIDRFAVEKHMVMPDHEVTVVHAIYSHKRTNELLDVKVRMKGWVKDGLIVRIEEVHDAKYVEAFERFVFFMQQAAADMSST